MNIIKLARELFKATTGFKSKCVAFSYIMFSLIILLILVLTTGLVIFGIASDDHTVYIQAVKEIFIPIVQVAAAFFGVAVGFVFGAQAITKDNKMPKLTSNNAPVEPAQP